jgi:hypothetical protein
MMGMLSNRKWRGLLGRFIFGGQRRGGIRPPPRVSSPPPKDDVSIKFEDSNPNNPLN